MRTWKEVETKCNENLKYVNFAQDLEKVTAENNDHFMKMLKDTQNWKVYALKRLFGYKIQSDFEQRQTELEAVKEHYNRVRDSAANRPKRKFKGGKLVI